MGKFESGIQSRIVTEVEKAYGQRIWIRVKHGDAFAVVGDPDLYGCLDGNFFAFEVKNEDGTLTKIQQHRLVEIRRANGWAFGVRSSEEALNILPHILVGAQQRRR